MAGRRKGGCRGGGAGWVAGAGGWVGCVKKRDFGWLGVLCTYMSQIGCVTVE